MPGSISILLPSSLLSMLLLYYYLKRFPSLPYELYLSLTNNSGGFTLDSDAARNAMKLRIAYGVTTTPADAARAMASGHSDNMDATVWVNSNPYPSSAHGSFSSVVSGSNNFPTPMSPGSFNSNLAAISEGRDSYC